MSAIFGLADLERVITFAKRYPVFPCRARDEEILEAGRPPRKLKAKSPLTSNGFHAATQDAAQIRSWWREWPQALVGVPTGQITGLVALDYDPDKATAATHAWMAEHTNLLCSSRAHKTARNGLHYLFASDDRYQTGTDLVLDGSPRKGIDLRANGGYVIWWPLHGGEVIGEAIAPLPAGLIDERRFDAKRDMAPLPSAHPGAWRAERDRVHLALAHVEPNGYESWIRIGMALHHASGGSDEGFALWHEWSSKGETYDGLEDCRYHWSSFGNYKGRALGLGSVYAAAKEAGYEPPAATRDPPDEGRFPPIETVAADGTSSTDTGPDENTAAPDVALIGFELAELLEPIPPERDLIAGMIPTEAYTVLAGALSAAKTTWMNLVHLSRATGFDLLQLEAHIEVGPCVLISYEDSDPRIRRRLLTCIQWGHAEVLRAHGKLAAAQFLERVVRNVRRITLTGQRGSALVCRDLNGNAAANMGQIETMLAQIRAFAAKELLIGIDPLRLAFRGSQNDDDGADVTVETLNMLAFAFPNSGLLVPTHTTKAGAIEPGTDRAAQAYATSGSALYSQHARSNFHLARPKPDDVRKLVHPEHVTEEEIALQRIAVLSHARLSHGPERGLLLYAMRKGVLVPVPAADAFETTYAKAKRLMPKILEAIARIDDEGGFATPNGLEQDAALRRCGGRNEVRDAVRQAIAQGWLEESGATRNKRLTVSDQGRQFSPPSTGENRRES